MSDHPFTVFVPVKSSSRGKSRLLLPPAHRAAIARAMALDTVTAIARVAPVVVIAEDRTDGSAFADVLGVQVHLTRAVGLNEAILDGVQWWGGGRVGSRAIAASGNGSGVPQGRAVAILPADLPGLDPADLLDALRSAAGYRSAVLADRQGSGTTLLTAESPDLLRPRYGPDSFGRHVESGAHPLDRPSGFSLRMDIDDPHDLLADLGPRTRIALAAAGRAGAGRTADADPGRATGADAPRPTDQRLP